MTSPAAAGGALRACLREASHRTPLIKRHASRAAHGPAAGARHQLDQAIAQAQALLDELKSAQLVLGWQEKDC